MAGKTNANIGFENSCGMQLVYCGGISRRRNIERLLLD